MCYCYMYTLVYLRPTSRPIANAIYRVSPSKVLAYELEYEKKNERALYNASERMMTSRA